MTRKKNELHILFNISCYRDFSILQIAAKSRDETHLLDRKGAISFLRHFRILQNVITVANLVDKCCFVVGFLDVQNCS